MRSSPADAHSARAAKLRKSRTPTQNRYLRIRAMNMSGTSHTRGGSRLGAHRGRKLPPRHGLGPRLAPVVPARRPLSPETLELDRIPVPNWSIRQVQARARRCDRGRAPGRRRHGDAIRRCRNAHDVEPPACGVSYPVPSSRLHPGVSYGCLPIAVAAPRVGHLAEAWAARSVLTARRLVGNRRHTGPIDRIERLDEPSDSCGGDCGVCARSGSGSRAERSRWRAPWPTTRGHRRMQGQGGRRRLRLRCSPRSYLGDVPEGANRRPGVRASPPSSRRWRVKTALPANRRAMSAGLSPER